LISAPLVLTVSRVKPSNTRPVYARSRWAAFGGDTSMSGCRAAAQGSRAEVDPLEVTAKRILHGALYPGVRVLARLSYPRKLTLLGVLLAIPAAYAGWAYTSEQNAKIAFSSKERVGVRYVQPVATLLGKLVAARHDAVAAAAARRPAAAPDIQREVSALAAVDRELGAELHTTGLWHDLQQKIDGLTSRPPRSAQTAFDAYSEATAGAQALIIQAGDKSNLILDPDLDSFYVMDAIITKLPAISDTLGRAGDRLSIQGGRVGVDQRIELAVDNGIVESAATAATAGLNTAFKTTKDTALSPQLTATLKRLNVQIENATANVTQTVQGNAADTTSVATAAATAAAVNVELPTHLDRLLTTRVAGFNAASRRVEIVLALGLAIALYAFASLYLLVTRSLREIAEAAAGLAEGDVDQQIQVDSRDEIGQVGRAFQDMVAYLAEMAAAATRIAQGDVSVDVEARSEHDELATAFEAMVASLREISEAAGVPFADLTTRLAEIGEAAGVPFADLLDHVTEQASIAERIAAGDLAVEVVPRGDRDVLGHAFQRMTENLRAMIGQVASAAVSVDSSSGQLSATSQEITRAMEEVARSVCELASGSDRQVTMLETANEYARVAVEASGEARAVAVRGMAAVEEASDAMDQLGESSLGVTTAIQQLAEKSNQIGGIVGAITGIAEQTNLLALNAAIEAARAGEQGLGFAVVAEEVRKLADESQQAAGSIAEIVREIQSETQRTVVAVQDSSARAQHGAVVVSQAREAFEQITDSVEQTTARVTDITAAAAEVVGVAAQNSAASVQVAAAAEQANASMQEISDSSVELKRLAEHLTETTRKFRLDTAASAPRRLAA
jgi:methyl-accepting chemotaxis protein